MVLAPNDVALGLAITCPLLMAFLVQYDSTRAVRLAVYPAGVISACWTIWSYGRDEGILRRRGGKMDGFSPGLVSACFEFLIKANISLAGPYTFSVAPLRSHPLPRQPPYPRLRSSKTFKAIDLILNYSKINIPPRPPLRSTSLSQASSRTKTFFTHISWSIFHTLLVDAFTLPIHVFFPPSFPSRSATRAHYAVLAQQWNVPYFAVVALVAALFGATVYNGIMAGWCAAKAIGVGSGIWLEEEWPDLMKRPYLASSMIEMWGKRYHQMLRPYFDTLLDPLQLPKPVYLLSAFTISAIHHVLMFYPITGFLNLHYLTFFIGSGLVCLFERYTAKLTGRRVGGVVGWIWMFFWSTVLSAPLIEVDYTWGFVQSFRPDISWRGRSLYPLDMLLGR